MQLKMLQTIIIQLIFNPTCFLHRSVQPWPSRKCNHEGLDSCGCRDWEVTIIAENLSGCYTNHFIPQILLLHLHARICICQWILCLEMTFQCLTQFKSLKNTQDPLRYCMLNLNKYTYFSLINIEKQNTYWTIYFIVSLLQNIIGKTIATSL